MRRWLACGLVGFWSLAASVTACGSDEGGGPNGTTPEAGVPESSTNGGNDGSTPGAVDILVADVTVYTGSRASLDASQTTATEFAWTVKSAPQGSTVTTQTLTGGTTARPSFVADVTGSYVLELTARSGGESATKSVTVKAVAAPIFYMQTSFTENPSYFEYRTIGTDKSGGHPIACRINGALRDAGEPFDVQLITLSMFLADMGLDWWEAPPGSPSRVAFSSLQLLPDGGRDSYLALGTSESTCATAPVILRQTPQDGGGAGLSYLQPRFSPNGSRLAFVEDRAEEGGMRVGAVSYDGNDLRDIAAFCPTDESCWLPAFFPPRPQWLDAQTIGWARSHEVDGGSVDGWEVMIANDSANPNPRVYMTCEGTVPRSIAFLPDGSVIANSAAPGTQIEDLRVFKPSTPGGACQLVRNLTNLGTARSYARDFMVSPDGAEVVFVRNEAPADAGNAGSDGTRFGGYLYVVPVNGSSAPVPFGGSPQAALFGGRYVASGSQIAWNGAVTADGGTVTVLGTDGLEDGGGAPAVRVGARDGTRITNVVAADVDAGVFAVGGGNGGACDFSLDLCSLSHGRLSTGGPLGMAAVALAFAFRRRSRRSS